MVWANQPPNEGRPVAIKDLEWAIGFWKERCSSYTLYERYYNGDHDLTFASEKWRNVFGPLLRKLRANLCPVFVDVPSDRLRIDGWDGTDAEAIQEMYDDAENGLARMFNQAWRDAAKMGDSYLLVWPDEDEESDTYEEPQFWPHDADQMVVRYSEDNPNRVEVAAKQWITKDTRGRVNLYYDDGTIEKYVTRRKVQSGGLPAKQSGWERVKDDAISGEPDVETDYGMPVVHFGKNADVGDYGVSVLRDVIPIQDALNKALCDLMVDMEFIAFPQRWATGLQVEVDEGSGKVKDAPFTPGVDRVWTGGQDVKYGEFSVGDMTQFTVVIDTFSKLACSMKGLPTHYLNLDDQIPTGEGLRVSEARMIAEIIGDQEDYNRPVVQALKAALLIKGGGSDKPKFKPVWADPNPHNPMLDAETQIVKQQVGVSQEQSLRELRYTDKQILQFQKENDAAAEKKAKAALALNLTGAGQPGQPPLPGQDKGTSGSPATGSQPKQGVFQRNGAPGTASKPAARQQQRRRPVPAPQ